MSTPITVIGDGFVGKFVSQKLSDKYRVEQIPARKIGGISSSLICFFTEKVTRIFSDKETIEGITEKIGRGERVAYAGKAGPLLDKLISAIKEKYPEKIEYFYILGTNGNLHCTEDMFPRLILNHAIKEGQVNKELDPTPFTPEEKSYFYHPNPSDFDREFVHKLGFNIELTSDKESFLKGLYLKYCVNIIYNSITIVTKSDIKTAVSFFEEWYPGFIDLCISDLFKIFKHKSPGLLSQKDIEQEIYYTKEHIPHVIPSSVYQFWKKQDDGTEIPDYKNSDVSILLMWALNYSNENNIPSTTLRVLMRKLRDKWYESAPDGEGKMEAVFMNNRI